MKVHPPLYLDIEYYLERQVGPALHRLFMLVRGESLTACDPGANGWHWEPMLPLVSFLFFVFFVWLPWDHVGFLILRGFRGNNY